MQPFRDTLWNIPEWAVILLYVTNFLGIALLIGKFWLRSRLWLKGQGAVQVDRLPQRLGRVLKFAGAQVKIARKTYAGIFHLSLFIAFIFLLIGTTLVFIEYDFTRVFLGFTFLKGPFYLIFEVVLDFFTVLAIIALALALARRVGTRPDTLTYSAGFQAMLWILLIDLLSGLTIETLRLAVVQPEWATWSFAGFTLSRALLALNPSEALLRSAHTAAWLFHIGLTALIYMIFLDLPLKHIIYSPLNIFFSSFKHPGALAPLNLEDEEAERFGVGQLTDLTWMQLMDGDACTECGRCQEACPAHMAGTPLNPKRIILDIRAGLDRYGPHLLDGRQGDYPLTHAIISEDALWACTTCRACVHECPVLIEHVDSIVDMRRYMVLTEGEVPDLLAVAMTQAERAGNPWGNPRGSRMQWADGLSVPVMASKKKADVLYWVGCAGSYDPESQKTTRAMIRIFEAAGIDYAVLGEEERCNCEWARRAGNEYLYQEATHSNIAVFDQYEFSTLVTHCPHCFNTFKNEYPQFGGHYDVVHHSTFITRLINEGHLKLARPIPLSLTFHDSCYLGRYNDVYDDPRAALTAVEGISLIEMARSRDRGLCCGGGGAQVWFETHQERPVNEIRLDEIVATGAQTVANACPFCTIMLSSAAQSRGITDSIRVTDLAVLVAEALDAGEAGQS
ncbi:MAG: heterodisulfide reductase-related iron-sulfur binding cluster [Anaerolineae bacterium]